MSIYFSEKGFIRGRKRGVRHSINLISHRRY